MVGTDQQNDSGVFMKKSCYLWCNCVEAVFWRGQEGILPGVIPDWQSAMLRKQFSIIFQRIFVILIVAPIFAPERWQSGRMRRSWKPLTVTGPGVRIPLSPLSPTNVNALVGFAFWAFFHRCGLPPILLTFAKTFPFWSIWRRSINISVNTGGVFCSALSLSSCLTILKFLHRN